MIFSVVTTKNNKNYAPTMCDTQLTLLTTKCEPFA